MHFQPEAFVCVWHLINQWKFSILLPGRKSGTKFMLNSAGVLRVSTVWKCRSDLVFRPHYFTDPQTYRTDGRRCFIQLPSSPAQIHLHYWWHCWNSPSLSWKNVNPVVNPNLGYHFPSHTIMLGQLLILSSPFFTFQAVLFLFFFLITVQSRYNSGYQIKWRRVMLCIIQNWIWNPFKSQNQFLNVTELANRMHSYSSTFTVKRYN